MSRYYTRVCNFYYGAKSRALVKDKKTLPLNGINEISFNQIEIISRKSKKIISFFPSRILLGIPDNILHQ